MANVKSARVSFAGGMQFDAVAGSGHSLVMDSTVDGGGQGAGLSPMELPLIALAGCMGMDVVSILRKQRQELTAYEVSIQGVRADEHPAVFVQITVEHTFTGHNLNQAQIERALELSSTRYCSVSAMLAKTARITHVVRLVEMETGAEPLP